jgi:subtilisin family serine protease
MPTVHPSGGGAIRRISSALPIVFLLAAIVAPASPILAVGPDTTFAVAGDQTVVKAIVTFDARPGRAAEQTIERRGGTVRRHLPLVNGLAVELSVGQMRHLATDAGVRHVELDPTLTAIEPISVEAVQTGDLEYDNAWGVSRLGAPAAHAAGIRGAGVRVAVIDTGIDYIHDDPDDTPYVVDPEFLGNYAGGFDFVNNDTDPFDDNGHGTHVAGILAAEKNGYLVAGVAPEVDLFALKILDANGEGDVSNLIVALQWAIDNDIDVVNMSLGTHEVSAALATAVANAAAQGLLMVAASGNVNPFVWQELLFGCPVTYPGAYPEVLSTTFTNPNDALTGYSCTGPEVDVASPGDAVFSPVPIGPCLLCKPWGYDALSGTSMASPHLAGTVALLVSAGIADAGTPGLFDDVRDRICTTADPGFGVNATPIPTNDPRYPTYFGCGVVDADDAVLGIVPPVNHPPVATDDTATTTEDAAVSIPVLANDTDEDGDGLSVSGVGSPANGTALLDPSGTAIQYTPVPGYSGTDAFSYTISDGAGGADAAAVTVTITAVDDPPTAEPRSASTTSPNPVSITLRGTDPDTCELSFQVIDLPTHGGVGSLTGATCATGAPNADTATVVYTPTPGYSGPDSFTYRVLDATGASAVVTVSITVLAAPPPNPIHVGDLDRSTSSAGKNWTARVTIRIHTAAEGSVAGAVITGTWSNGASGTATCTTNSSGACTVQKTKLSKATVATVTFTVTSVTVAGSTYTAAANHDPDGDSNGTTITVFRPT